MQFSGEAAPVEMYGIQHVALPSGQSSMGGVNVAGVVMSTPRYLELNTEGLASRHVGTAAQVVGVDSLRQEAHELR